MYINGWCLYVYSKLTKCRMHGSYVYYTVKITNIHISQEFLSWLPPSHCHRMFHQQKSLRQETSPIWQRGNAPIADHVQSCTSDWYVGKKVIIPKCFLGLSWLVVFHQRTEKKTYVIKPQIKVNISKMFDLPPTSEKIYHSSLFGPFFMFSFVGKRPPFSH